MRSVFMIIGQVRNQKTTQVRLVEHDDVVQQIVPDTLDESFGYAVLPGFPVSRLLWLDTNGIESIWDLLPVDTVTVEDRVFRRRFKRECFSELLDNPWGGRFIRDVEMNDIAPTMRDDEKDV